jgi:hypothetical protein
MPQEALESPFAQTTPNSRAARRRDRQNPDPITLCTAMGPLGASAPDSRDAADWGQLVPQTRKEWT